jgi:CheY-like chemotaxis protein
LAVPDSARQELTLRQRFDDGNFHCCHLFTQKALERALAPHEERPTAPARPVEARGNLLLVEDHEINAEVASRMLESEGYVVHHAASGEQALELAPHLQQLDLILMDIQMPGLDGYQTTERIRTLDNCRDVPIIALTAHAMTSDRTRALEAGMNDYLTKPLDPKRLHNCLQRWHPLTEHTAAPAPEATPGPKSGHRVFDSALALRQTGNSPELLNRLIDKFIEQHAGDIATLRQRLQAEDRDSALLLVHTLKGIAQTLALGELSTLAARGEAALKAQATQECRALLPSPDDALARGIDQLRRCVGASSAGSPTQATAESVRSADEAARDKAMLMAQVGQLLPLLDAGDIDSLELIEQLLTHRSIDTDCQALIETLSKQAGEFDFTAAADTARAAAAAALARPPQQPDARHEADQYRQQHRQQRCKAEYAAGRSQNILHEFEADPADHACDHALTGRDIAQRPEDERHPDQHQCRQRQRLQQLAPERQPIGIGVHALMLEIGRVAGQPGDRQIGRVDDNHR